MKGWVVLGTLAAVLLGALSYVAFEGYIYTNGLNLNWKAISIGALALGVALVGLVFGVRWIRSQGRAG